MKRIRLAANQMSEFLEQSAGWIHVIEIILIIMVIALPSETELEYLKIACATIVVLGILIKLLLRVYYRMTVDQLDKKAKKADYLEFVEIIRAPISNENFRWASSNEEIDDLTVFAREAEATFKAEEKDEDNPAHITKQHRYLLYVQWFSKAPMSFAMVTKAPTSMNGVTDVFCVVIPLKKEVATRYITGLFSEFSITADDLEGDNPKYFLIHNFFKRSGAGRLRLEGWRMVIRAIVRQIVEMSDPSATGTITVFAEPVPRSVATVLSNFGFIFTTRKSPASYPIYKLELDQPMLARMTSLKKRYQRNSAN